MNAHYQVIQAWWERIPTFRNGYLIEGNLALFGNEQKLLNLIMTVTFQRKNR